MPCGESTGPDHHGSALFDAMKDRFTPPVLRSMSATAIIAAGLVWVSVLLSHVGENAFYTSDAGLKYLMVLHMEETGFRTDLPLPEEQWIIQAWEDGYAPLRAPFAYQIGDRWNMAFPIFFPALTMPLHRAFGFAGLFVMPVLALAGIWILFAVTCHRLRLSPLSSTLSLCTLVLGMPLAIYGAVFWEHTPAVLLNFLSLFFVMECATRSCPPWKLIAGGLVGGLAVWFRPESVCVQALITISLLTNGRRTGAMVRLLHPAMFAVALGGLLLFNTVAYGNPGGAHAIEKASQRGEGFFTTIYYNLTFMLMLLIKVSPICIGGFLTGILAMAKGDSVKSAESSALFRFLFPIALVPMLMIPFVTPNFGGFQWGPRYFLVLLPILALWFAVGLEILSTSEPALWRRIAFSLFGLLLALSIKINLVDGTRHLVNKYEIHHPELMNVFGDAEERHIIVNSQHSFLITTPLYKRKNYFYARKREELIDLAKRLLANDETRFLHAIFIAESSDFIEQRDNQIVWNQRLLLKDEEIEIRLEGSPVTNDLLLYSALIAEKAQIGTDANFAPSPPPRPSPEP